MCFKKFKLKNGDWKKINVFIRGISLTYSVSFSAVSWSGSRWIRSLSQEHWVCTGHIAHIFTPRGNFSQPIHTLVCFSTSGGNQRTLGKLTYIWGAYPVWKARIPIWGSNPGPRSCNTPMLPAVFPWIWSLIQSNHNWKKNYPLLHRLYAVSYKSVQLNYNPFPCCQLV